MNLEAFKQVNCSQTKASRRRDLASYLLTAPALIWLLVFFLVPYLIVFIYSFLSTDIYDVSFKFSLSAYRQLFSGIYLRPFYLAFRLAFITTFACLILAFPVAYYIARASEKMRNMLLILIIIPFWTNLIIRIFSWRIFLSYNGVLNTILLRLGLISTPLELMRTDFTVLLVMVYVYLPYMILPLYSALEKMDFTLLQAAMDLGANEVKAFFRITLPLAAEGIFAGSLLVFIPTLGAYLIPQLVGNQRSLYVGQVITYKIKNIPRNWPMASAMSFVLLLLVAAMLIVMYAIYRKRTLAKRNV
ncbi:MAG TPA: ABC transporter permease [Candidatus Cloacimonadota bacterium]|jgi:spermidine/putrescine transport system permease protein|nr:ABC transporter permease [Candidatus Cloacimonadota bacterium]HOF59186.1 ABC transporter permease [Candidatus Cloacimonadota bacterium]HOR59549.1 ABC transporter permease [Candidatus Cloacimonadota bacterium]HPB08472.1 ABC transporter permease [Candidatus Cloacimonadota bacterium]HQL13354.1 ABC transporter permease [Candidatus Cloacimonadota bacterium]